MKLMAGLVAMIASVLLAGCAGNLESVHHEFKLSDGTSHFIDAFQRGVFVDADRTDPTHHVLCAEPSPDALSVLSASLAGSGTSGNVTASASASIAQAATAFGLRTQSIQLLRDSYYRLCEAYLSGALDKSHYEMMLRRYGNDMVALLAIEQLTNAIRPETPNVSAPAQPSQGGNTPAPGDSKTPPAGDNKTPPANNNSGAQGRNTVAPSGQTNARSAGVARRKPLRAASLQNISYMEASAGNAAAQDPGANQAPADPGTAKPAPKKPAKPKPAPAKPDKPATPDAPAPNPPGGNQPPGVSDIVAKSVQAIAEDVLNVNYSTQICVAYFQSLEDQHASPLADDREKDTELARFCRSDLDDFSAGRANANDRIAHLNQYFQMVCLTDPKKQSADTKKNCASLALAFAGAPSGGVPSKQQPVPGVVPESKTLPPL